MEQRELTKAGPDGQPVFTLMVVLHLDDPDDLYGELRTLKATLLEWHATRGSTAASVFFAVISDPRWHAAIESFVAMMHAQEIDLADLFRSIPLTLMLKDPEGGDPHERRFEPGSSPAPASAPAPAPAPAPRGWWPRFRAWFGPGAPR